MYPWDDVAAFETWEPCDGKSWEALVAWQDDRCAMCGKRANRLVEDHNHRTGKSRGILCWSCNVCEGATPHDAWSRWRDGNNPASVFGVVREYPGRTYADDEWTEEDEARAIAVVQAIPGP